MPDLHDTPIRAFEPKVDGSEYTPYAPDPSASIKLPAERQALLNAVIDLYSSRPSEAAMLNYARESVYDDPLSYVCFVMQNV